MHGLRTIKKLNKTEQDFIDHILATPYHEVNLLEVWKNWKAEQEHENEPVSLHSDR